jgi:hypothetical protein
MVSVLKPAQRPIHETKHNNVKNSQYLRNKFICTLLVHRNRPEVQQIIWCICVRLFSIYHSIVHRQLPQIPVIPITTQSD